MSGQTETVLQYLQRMRRKDEEKGGSGWRSTREVCEYFDMKPSSALAELKVHEVCYEIACAQDGAGYVWKATADGDIRIDNEDGSVEYRFASVLPRRETPPAILTMTTEACEPGTWVDGMSFKGEVTSARVEDGELKIEAKSGPIIIKIALPASTTFEPTTKTFPDGTTLNESVPLYRQQMGRAYRPGAKLPTTFVCDPDILTAGLVENPTSLPDAVRAYLAALDAMDGSATNAIAYTNQRDTLAECLADLRTAAAQVIP